MSDGDNKVLKLVFAGCGGILFITALGMGTCVFYFASQPEGGVKLANEMDAYALQYLDQHGLLEPGESVVAYYDATISMDGSEAAILTDRRVMYHHEGRTSDVALAEIADIRHRSESFIGDVIEVDSTTGSPLKIEIAPLNQGESFLNALRNARARAQTGEGEQEQVSLEE